MAALPVMHAAWHDVMAREHPQLGCSRLLSTALAQAGQSTALAQAGHVNHPLSALYTLSAQDACRTKGAPLGERNAATSDVIPAVHKSPTSTRSKLQSPRQSARSAQVALQAGGVLPKCHHHVL